MKTKTVLLAVALVLGLSPLARAQSVPFDYTGISATDEDADYVGYHPNPTWISGLGNPQEGSVGGNINQSGYFGSAQQFTISVPTNISALDINATVFQGPDYPYPVVPYQTEPVFTTVTWDIYSGSSPEESDGVFYPNEPVPGTLEFQSTPITYAAPTTVESITNNQQLAFDADLQPGTYWLAEEGTGGESVGVTTTYVDPSMVAPVPEPPTLLLFLFTGVLILAFNFRKLGRLLGGLI